MIHQPSGTPQVIRAISLWQPYASLMAVGAKRIETRSWPVNYRGPVVLHASKRCIQSEMIDFNSMCNYCAALSSMGKTMGACYFQDILPFGALIAIADLVDCRETSDFTNGELDELREPADPKSKWLGTWTERQFGDYSLGRYGHVYENVRMFESPIPYRGEQGWFHVPISVIEEPAP